VRVLRWAPLAATLAFVAGVLLRDDTPLLDLLRYAGYGTLAVLLPGTLVYRLLRGKPHTMVEDLALGAAVGLCLELAGWALFSWVGLLGYVWLWPLLVIVPLLFVRRVWRFTYNLRAPLGWSWAVAGVVCWFTAYLAAVFLDRNPVLPRDEDTLQYLDLSYQLSLAGGASNGLPPDLPQVAGEPLYYHWFAYVHLAMTGLVGHIDLPVVALRLAVPGLCALAIVLTAVVGWRVSGRPYVGAVASVLFFAVGEFNFSAPVSLPFGTEVAFVVWHGVSMTYAWVLVIALIVPLVAVVSADRVGWRQWVLCGLLVLGSSGGKGSTLPVVGLALLLTAVAVLVSRRRIPWGVLGAGLLVLAGQLFATVVIYHFQSYGVTVGPLSGLAPFWTDSPSRLAPVGVWVAFGLNMLLRTAGIVPLLWLTRGRLDPAQWLLVGGGVAGLGLYLVLAQPGSGNQYFLRTGFAFAVIASAWGYGLLLERADLPRWAGVTLGAAAVGYVLVLVVLQLRNAPPVPDWPQIEALLPLLRWAAGLTGVAVLLGFAWWLAARRLPALRRRGGLVLLTGVLLAGAPGLVMDAAKSLQAPNGGPYPAIPLPQSRVDAARWVRDHSGRSDVLATNVHCLSGEVPDACDSRSFWLSAYAERPVLVEGWGFSPRQALVGLTPFWNPALLSLNDAAFTDPTPSTLDELRDGHGVRWLVVDRAVGEESPLLRTLAEPVYDNGRLAVYRLP
jgi:hypothetical protein